MAGPACDAGACADKDGDGFVACTCAPAGVPCDCDDGDPLAFPGAPEACDATKDLDCSGASKEGCAKDFGCLDGVCLGRCIPLDDFGCPPTTGMKRQPDNSCLCVPQDCTLFGCKPGFTCDDDKTCVPSCAPNVKCPAGQRCRGFGCVDPCAGVTCPAGSTCRDGACIPSCDCPSACPTGETCDLALNPPRCRETACSGVTCRVGTHCVQGTCVDDCSGVVCPPKRVCKIADGGGACVDLCNPSPCPLGYRCDWRTGACMPPDVGDVGLFPGDTELDPLDVVGGGIACSASSFASASALVAFVFVALVALRRFSRTR